MDKYNFNYKRKEYFENNEEKNLEFQYLSEINLKNLENNNLDYLFFRLEEKNINFFINKKKLNNDEIKIFYIFNCLNLFLFKNNNYLMASNIEEINSRIFTIERLYSRKYNILNKVEQYKKIVNNKKLLFETINNNRFIKCFFSNPYFKKYKFSNDKIGFSLNNFIGDLKIPIIITECKNENEVEIKGIIDTSIINNVYFLKKLEGIFNINNIEIYCFNYESTITFKNKKIFLIKERINFKINNEVKIQEEIIIKYRKEMM